ncbi:hypothetical protein MUK42_05945 [Musa troglodytarum]|uniref:Uncharacterized protein n=1 Tax=Musa troglodytarum TaxID=320322 RepID=A0A9E7ESI7_9LILI|nr:hypothetical protein MUK42_05945 [Musa troglodytarum]
MSDDRPSRVFYELVGLLLRGPQPRLPAARTVAENVAGGIRLNLGASLVLMLCGSVAFILMPWVVGLLIVSYLVRLVPNLSDLGRAVLRHSSGPSSPKEMLVEFF